MPRKSNRRLDVDATGLDRTEIPAGEKKTPPEPTSRKSEPLQASEPEFSLHENLPSDSPYGYPALRAELSLRHIVANGFAIGMIQADQEALDWAAYVRDVIKPSHICELGTLCGGMFYVMDRMGRPGVRISVDMPWKRRDPAPCWPDYLFKTAVGNITEVIGNAHDQATCDAVKAALDGRQLDLLFIDCDHSYEGGRKHWEMYGPLVRPGGYVGWHDIRNGWPVGKFYDELCATHEHVEFVAPPGAIFGIGVVKV